MGNKIGWTTIDNYEFAKIKSINLDGFKSSVLIMFKADRRQDSLKTALDKLFTSADEEIEKDQTC